MKSTTWTDTSPTGRRAEAQASPGDASLQDEIQKPGADVEHGLCYVRSELRFLTTEGRSSMARIIRRAVFSAVLLALCAAPAAALEATLLFGRPSGGELGEFGYQVRGAGDLNGDGIGDFVVGAPYDDTIGLNAGRAFVWFGGDALSPDPDLILDDCTGSDYFGFAVAGIGDVDGDGIDDLAVGAPGARRAGAVGVVYLYRGGVTMDDVVDRELAGEVAGDRFGWSISAAGDMDRDGTDDFVVGAPYNDSAGQDVGRVYLFTGQGSMATVGPLADVVFTGETGAGPTNTTHFADFAPDGQSIQGPGFGFTVASVGNFRGDGRAALAVGAPGQAGATGRAYLYFAAATAGQLPSASPAVTLTNNVANEQFGWTVAGGGTIDADALADLLVGAPGTNGNTGSVHLYYGQSSPPATISAANAERTRGTSGYRFGFAVAGAGNANGSANNWLVGAPANSEVGALAGRVYLYSGTSATPTEVGPVGAAGQPVAQDQWGFSLDGLRSDLDGDGREDFLVGAPTANAPDNAVRGSAAVVSSGARIVAAPSLRLDGVQRLGTQVELGFSGAPGPVEDAVLYNEGREIARLGAGIWADSRGLTARVPTSSLQTNSVDLRWSVDGLTLDQHFDLPNFRGNVATLHPASPNPFNPRTTLAVELPEGADVRLRIFDLRGREVRELFSGRLEAGITPIMFDGTDQRGRALSSGTYLAVLETGEYRAARRLALVR